MAQSSFTSERMASVAGHLTAGGAALAYAWYVSKSVYVTTGIQFISPLAAILAVHLLWMAFARQLTPGFAKDAISRTFLTSFIGVAVLLLASIYAPMPTQASESYSVTVGSILSVVFCVAILAGIVFLIGAALFAVGKGIAFIYHAIKQRGDNLDDTGDSRFLEVGSIALVFGAIALASLEGVTGAYSFSTGDRSSSSYDVNASPRHVWQFVGEATSPKFPLPEVLSVFPQPVAVLVDEGAELGARRVVHIKGREGAGNLTLQVVERTPDKVVFKAMSDTSPIARWVRHKFLTFKVEPKGQGSVLTVTLDYDRLLAPAWFFRPAVNLAAYFAVDVLARDTKTRAERA